MFMPEPCAAGWAEAGSVRCAGWAGASIDGEMEVREQAVANIKKAL